MSRRRIISRVVLCHAHAGRHRRIALDHRTWHVFQNQSFNNGKHPSCQLPCLAPTLLLVIKRQKAHRHGKQATHVFQQRTGKIVLRLLHPVTVGDGPHTDHRVVHAHRVIGLEGFQRLLLMPQQQVALCHAHVNRQLADLRIVVLLDHQQRALKQRHRAPGQRLVVLLKGKDLHHQRRLIHHVEAVRVAHHGLLRLVDAARVLGVAQIPQPREGRVTPVILDHVPDQRVHRRIEEIRHLHQHRQLRQGKPRLPFVNRARRHAQRLGELLLRQAARLAQAADVIAQSKRHVFSSLRHACIIAKPGRDFHRPAIPIREKFFYRRYGYSFLNDVFSARIAPFRHGAFPPRMV